MNTKSAQELLQAIRSLPPRERLQLVERVIHDLSDERGAIASQSIVGLFADDPALMDAVCEAAMTARERDALRRPSD